LITLLQSRSIILGVTGSIACYKAVDLASKLTQAGAFVDVLMTDSAQRFVAPLTFRSVTGREVYTDMWGLAEHVQHVQLGETADLLVIAPSSAHTLAKLAHGLADNLLTVTALAARCPLLLAPAMDGGMYEHPATQANVRLLQERGVVFAGPAGGRMASGLLGLGRMVEPAELMGHIRLLLGRQGALHGRHIVVSAGPTQEPVDPVRYLTNRSSGKQGVALAQAALDAGARVTLIAGPMIEPPPLGVTLVGVETAVTMAEAVLTAVGDADALLMAAAVADFRPADPAGQKIKKTEGDAGERVIRLAPNPDILTAVKEQKAQTGFPRLTVGFAAETQNALAYGQAKLQRKGLDFIAINDVSATDAGFAVNTNRVTLLGADGSVVELPLLSKTAVAEEIVGRLVRALVERPTTKDE
jgi:phosphopantothenoylcysteine decarboxylase / phosphopantothenate---cysteine ligase